MASGQRLRWFAVLVCCGLLTSPGCSFGPKVLQKTHGQYAESVRQVEEEQLLSQIVRLRYNESFLGLDITSIAAQYELSSSAEARPFFLAPNPSNANVFKTFTSILPDLTVNGANRPTISFAPIDDGASVRRFLTPITLDTLIFLTQTSWPASTVMRLWVERMNGVPNAIATPGLPKPEAPDFERFLRIAELMQTLQDQEIAAVRTVEQQAEIGGPFPAETVSPAAAVEAAKNGLEYHPRPDGKSWGLFRRERRLMIEVSSGAENRPELFELASLLNLVPGRKTYELSLAARGSPDPLKFPTPPGTELRIVPRSSAQVLLYLSNGVDVPADHFCSGLVVPATGPDGKQFDLGQITQGLFTVRVCDKHRPPQAYVAVRYRDHWYYIDDCDRTTKATFALVFNLSRLDFSRQTLGTSPLLTLPVGR